MEFNPVGVVIPTYNRQTLLKECLRSVFQQDIGVPFDVFVVEDGSEVAADVIASLEQEVKEAPAECEVYHLPLPTNSGTPAYPMNVAMQMCENDLLAICNDDDLWLPHHLRTQVEGLKKYNLDVAYTRYRVQSPYSTVEEATENGSLPDGYESLDMGFDPRILAISPLHNYVSPHITLRRGRVFELVGPEVWDQSISQYEDWEFLLRAAKAGIVIGKASSDITHIYRWSERVDDEESIQIKRWKEKSTQIGSAKNQGVVRWNGSSSVRW